MTIDERDEDGKFVTQENREVREGGVAGSQGATRTVDWVTDVIRMMIRSGACLVDQYFLQFSSGDQLSPKGWPVEWDEVVNNAAIIGPIIKHHYQT